MSLPSLSIKRPVTITMFYIGIAILGIYVFSLMGVDLLPNINIPHLIVQTEYKNSTPEEVENLITEPLESAVGSVSGVKKIVSVSKEDMSVVSVDFNWGTDMKEAVLSLREKLDNMRFSLPREAGRPSIVHADPSAAPIITVALSFNTSGGRTRYVGTDSPVQEIKRLTALRETARALFRRRLEQIDGVAQAVVTGGLEKEILISIKPGKLAEYRISVEMIKNAVRNANKNLSAGKIMKGVFRYSLRLEGEFSGAEEINNTVIKNLGGGNVIHVKDLARVTESFKERNGFTRLNGAETIGLHVYKEPEANTVNVAERVRKTLNKMKIRYPEFNSLIITDQSEFITSAIFNVKLEALFGGLLAASVLFFFLGSIRNIAAIALTIPASLLITVLLMRAFDISFNIISLGGMALGIGMLMDNAIIVIENVVRYREAGMGIAESALLGASEVSMPVFTATLTTIAVFLPLIFVPGIAGEIFRDQSFAIAFSLSASIIAALTLIPLIISEKKKTFINARKYEGDTITIKRPGNGLIGGVLFYISFPFVFLLTVLRHLIMKSVIYLKKKSGQIFLFFFEAVNKQMNKLISKYETFLNWGLNNRAIVIIVTSTLFALTALAFYNIKKEFIPESVSKEFVVELTFPKGVSLKGNSKISGEIENALFSLPGVKYVVADIGRVNEYDFLNKENISIENTALTIKLKDEEFYYPVRAKIRALLKNIGNIDYSFRPVKTAYSGVFNPSESDIVIKIKQNDIHSAFGKAEELKREIESLKIEGLKEIWIGTEKGLSGYEITIDRKNCAAFGISPGEVVSFFNDMVKGSKAAYFSEFDSKVGIKIQTDANERDMLGKVLTNEIMKNNLSIPLKKLVNVKRTENYTELWREERTRIVYLFIDAAPGYTEAVANAAAPVIDNAVLAPGQIIEMGGTDEEISSSFASLSIALLVSVLLMYMILASEFESFVFPFIIIFAVPLGLIGGVLLLYLFGQSINIISVMGLIILVGISDNDAVVKVEFILRKRAEGFSVRDSIMLAGKERFRPIVMNSLTVIFGLVPMIIGFGVAGTQLRVSLALAIAGGLISSTVLTLVVIPVLYTYFERLSKKIKRFNE